ncbi:MAG: gamma-glutamyl-gamma-aminobutyrate hydrolase family protein [candidate division KSB1 bacterium]|nr:gamma-glutamyl-gamma-aminobutyrate hydrolase family protein [candidate division KSB1 bacterium]MDZ7346822.1 gamma-glutamyl-gamma-aminobutyrate hydrolase family protein [candidate division KSB1 bacterium]
MTQAPLVGITTDFATDDDSLGSAVVEMSYVEAVYEAGGIPVLVPPLNADRPIDGYLDRLDGLVLIGGDDVWPSAYGEKPHSTVDSLPAQRFLHERRLIQAWLERTKKPILGICLGCQFTNVVCGGSLIQDIPSQIGTGVKHWGGIYHTVRITPGSRLQKILGQEQVNVLSNHHQAVRRIGTNLKPVASAEDGIIEALEWTGDRFGLFVQWHPERMPIEHRKKLFGAFIEACKKN